MVSPFFGFWVQCYMPNRKTVIVLACISKMRATENRNELTFPPNTILMWLLSVLAQLVLPSACAMALEDLKIICFDKIFGFDGQQKG